MLKQCSNSTYSTYSVGGVKTSLRGDAIGRAGSPKARDYELQVPMAKPRGMSGDIVLGSVSTAAQVVSGGALWTEQRRKVVMVMAMVVVTVVGTGVGLGAGW